MDFLIDIVPVLTLSPRSTDLVPVVTLSPPSTDLVPVVTPSPPSTDLVPVVTPSPPSTDLVPVVTPSPPSTDLVPAQRLDPALRTSQIPLALSEVVSSRDPLESSTSPINLHNQTLRGVHDLVRSLKRPVSSVGGEESVGGKRRRIGGDAEYVPDSVGVGGLPDSYVEGEFGWLDDLAVWGTFGTSGWD
jgi:hypothetical protein